MFSTIAVYCFLGAIAGILAGLLGIGGGTVVVPMFVFALGWQKLPPDIIIHLAIGTSLASIMFTAVSSSLAHHRRGGVDWNVVKGIALSIILGTYGGSFVAARIPARWLQIFFVCFLLYVATNMLLNKKPNPSRTLPGFAGLTGAGLVIGSVSSFVGIGGGTLSVPYLIWHNVDMRRAVGTSAAIGFPIALAGCIGYVTNGWGHASLPAHTSDKITVKGWNAATHNIVYATATDLKPFTTYLNAASPTDAHKQAAQDSVFKAAKLA